MKQMSALFIAVYAHPNDKEFTYCDSTEANTLEEARRILHTFSSTWSPRNRIFWKLQKCPIVFDGKVSTQ